MAARDDSGEIAVLDHRHLIDVFASHYFQRRRCPEHISVLSFDDFEWAANFSPKLTTIAQPTHEMGKEAMRMLLAIMRPEGEDSDLNEDNIVMLKAELRIRESTAPPIT